MIGHVSEDVAVSVLNELSFFICPFKTGGQKKTFQNNSARAG